MPFQKRFRRALAAAALSVSLLVPSLSCTKQDENDGNQMVLRVHHPDDVATMDPANAYDAISLDVLPSILETLYQFSYLSDTYGTVPLLAADMPEVSEDRLTVTIPIRRGVRYADDPCFKETQGKGRELKAQDFVLAFKRLALPSLQSRGWWTIDGRLAGMNAFRERLISAPKGDVMQAFAAEVPGVTAVDDYTLRLKLTKPYPQLTTVLAMTFTAPVPQEAVAAYADEIGNLPDHPVGTGPFTLKSWKRGHELVLERNPTHHPEFYPTDGGAEYRKRGMLADAGKPLPFLDRIVVKVIRESQPAWQAFKKGSLDAIPLPRDAFEEAIENRVNLRPEMAARGIRLTIDVGGRFHYLSFNMRDRVLGSSKYLRQALSSAIDRDRWIELFTNGRGRKMENALPPGLKDRPKTAKMKYDYDPAAAKELLKKAGYPEGKGLPILNLDMRGSDSARRRLGELLAGQLAAVGVKLNVIYNTFPAFLEKLRAGNTQIAEGSWGLDYPDAENVFQLVYGPFRIPGPNETGYDSPEMNRMFEKITTLEPGPRRAELIQKMDDLLQEDCPWALGYYHSEYQLSHPWLLNFRPSEVVTNRYKYYRINRDVKARYRQ